MAHYAFLNNQNIVEEVIVGVDENDLIENENPEIWYAKFRGKKCVRTSYNGNIRKQFAAIGYKYDEANDIFIEPQPYNSWILDENYDWISPIPRPSEGYWYWDENKMSWIEISDNDAKTL